MERSLSGLLASRRDYDVVFEPDAGMLAAARAVALMVELARRHGGERTQVLEQTPVRRIDLDGDRPVVVTDGADPGRSPDRLIRRVGETTFARISLSPFR